MECADDGLMTFFLAVYEFYYIHKNIGMILQQIATDTFSTVGGFFSFFFFQARFNLVFMREQEWARSFCWVGQLWRANRENNTKLLFMLGKQCL